ncbi:uncharacterized protein LOC133444867 [Cololabis saira]|uniref:uncharacterized protein LOC133444867 n=1 Tax=Cololabis saira TaxID=129043 RepID=UPI002AD39070|nr:uncharacterized protein LOC133444867 [Cololabis saira]
MRTKLHVAGRPLPHGSPLSSQQVATRVGEKQKKSKAYTDQKRGATAISFACWSYVRVKKPGILPKTQHKFSEPLKVVGKKGQYSYLLSDGRCWNASHLAPASLQEESDNLDFEAIPAVALENTRKKFEVKQPLVEPVDGEMDQYGDESGDGGQNEGIPAPGKACGVKFNAMPCPVERCISGEVCMSPSLELDTKNLPDSKSQDEFSCKSLMFGKTDSKQLAKAEAEPSQFCSCVHSHLSSLCLKQCFECKGLHYYNCDSLKICKMNGHKVKYAGNPNESEEPSLPSGVSSDPPPYDSAAMPSLAPCDEPTPVSQSIHPISFHGCCDLTKPDPQVLCRSCSVFHSGSCREGDLCQTNHDICPLGVCSCGKLCSRKPLVLCRYCGREFCTNCWYRNPVSCICGQTFDQSSSV